MIRRLWSDLRGVSAVEFALVAPLLVFGSISTVDAGIAVYEKMMIGQVLRSGAHLAIAADSVADVQTMLEATAADNFTVASGTPADGELAVAVTNYCICAADTSTQVTCTTTCSGGADPLEFYTLSADKTYTGLFLPAFQLSGTIDVLAQ